MEAQRMTLCHEDFATASSDPSHVVFWMEGEGGGHDLRAHFSFARRIIPFDPWALDGHRAGTTVASLSLVARDCEYLVRSFPEDKHRKMTARVTVRVLFEAQACPDAVWRIRWADASKYREAP